MQHPRKRHRLSAAAAALCLLAPSASARGLTPDDVLARAAFGQAEIAPGDRWLVAPLLGPYASAARFDYDRYSDILRTTLQLADLRHPGPLRPLFAPEPGVGYQAGPISPDGRQMAVFRLKAERWELGLATFGDGQVRWLGVTPEVSDRGRTVQWAGAHRILVIALPAGVQPFEFRSLRAQIRAGEAYAAQARGELTATVVGSGRFLGLERRDAPKQLISIDAGSGRTTVLAEGAFDDLEVSASGRSAALLEAGEDIALQAHRPVQGDQGTEVRRRRLVLIDLRSGEVRRPCPSCDMLGQLLAWAPGSEQLLVYARTEDQAWTGGQLLQIDGAGGVETLADRGVTPLVLNRPATVRAGWLGDAMVVYGRRSGAQPGQAAWFRLDAHEAVVLSKDLPGEVPRDGLAADGRTLLAVSGGQAWRMDVTGQARAATPLGFQPIDPAALRPARRFERGFGSRSQLVGTLRVGEQRMLAIVGGRDRTSLAPLPNVGDVQAVASDGRGALVRTFDRGLSERLEWITAAGGRTTLAAINTHMADVDAPRLAAIRHRGERGEPLTSWLALPPQTATGRPPPLVVIPYPGSVFAHPPQLDEVQRGADLERAALLVGHGYAVLLPSLPADPTSRGPGVGLAARVLRIVDAAAQQSDLKGAFDPQRLGVWGFSFGGYATLAMLTQTDRFRVAIAKSPITDLFSQHGDTPALGLVWPEGGPTSGWSAGWTEDLQGDMRGPPWAQPQRYLANSPTTNADRITTPVMIVHGDLDTIPIGQSEEMFTSLFRQAKDAVFVAYLGEAHLVTSPGNIRDYYARGFAWLDRYLGLASGATVNAAPSANPGPGSASTGPTTRPAPPG